MTTCKIEDCAAAIFTKKSGLCSAHYFRERRGSKRTTPPEAFHNFPSYTKAHTAVAQARGKASQYPCVICLGPAAHWSLMTLDNAQKDTWTVNKGMWFSNSIWDYSPCCYSDHFMYEQAFGLSKASRGRPRNSTKNLKNEPTG